MSSQHVQVIIVSGPDEPKRLLLGLSMAAGAAAAGTIVNIFLAMDGAKCLLPDACERTLLDGYPTVAELLSVVKDCGGVVEYCPHCLPTGCAHHPADHAGSCGCKGVPAGLTSYGVRIGDWPTVVF